MPEAVSVTPSIEDVQFMRLALHEAGRAFDKDEVPVGAVIVKGGVVIALAHNLRESTKDPTAHAEILALRSATQSSDSWRLLDATLYVTKEPCIMCAGAMLNARIARLVYGCRDLKAGGAESLYRLLSDRRLNHQVEMITGVLEDESAGLLRRFFGERR